MHRRNRLCLLLLKSILVIPMVTEMSSSPKLKPSKQLAPPMRRLQKRQCTMNWCISVWATLCAIPHRRPRKGPRVGLNTNENCTLSH
jgi:hypothetical protein